MVKGQSWGSRLFDASNHLILLLVGLLCLMPLVHMLALSLSDRASATAHLVGLWPINPSFANYEWVLGSEQFKHSFYISIMRTVAGTLINVAVTVLAAYPLSVKDDFPGKHLFKWALVFSMLFNGGLIPWFMAMRSLGLVNTLWGLILYPAVSAFNIIIAVNFFKRLPQELSDAAAIDGASHWDILFRIVIPLSLPMLATITLFTAVMHWNSWFDGLVLMTSVHNYPLQTFLQTQLALSNPQSNEALSAQLSSDPYLFRAVSERSVRAAEIILTVIPIILIYPFLQRYFIHGLTLGAVKE